MTITPAQCRAARAGIELSRAKLAETASVSIRTVIDFERRARQPFPATLAAIRAGLESHGITFTDAGCICLPPDDPE